VLPVAAPEVLDLHQVTAAAARGRSPAFAEIQRWLQ
jgi:hypothetical protein